MPGMKIKNLCQILALEAIATNDSVKKVSFTILWHFISPSI